MTEMELITVALEDMLNNYDKRIRPGYGGIFDALTHLSTAELCRETL